MTKLSPLCPVAASLLLIVGPGVVLAQSATPAATPAQAPKGAGDSLAVVNGMPVHTATFEAYLKHVLRVPPTTVTSLDLKRNYLRKFAVDWALAEKATKAGLGPMVEANIFKDTREVLYDYYVNTVLAKQIIVEEKDVADGVGPLEDERTVDAIVVQDAATAALILEELKKGTAFTELAKRHSVGMSASQGGTIGIVRGTDSRFTSEQKRVIFSLKEGEVSQPLEHEHGLLLLRLTKLIPKETLRKDRMDEIRGQLFNERFTELRKKTAAELRAKASIWIDEKFFETGEKEPMTDYIAKVNGVTISSLGQTTNAGLPHEVSVHSGKVNRGLLDGAIESILFAQEAEKGAVAKDPGVVARLTAIRIRALASAYLTRNVPQFSEMPVDEKEIETYYKKNYEPVLFRTRMILAPTKQAAEAIRKEILAGGNFEKIAKKSSVDQSGKKGGDTGYYPAGKMKPEFGAVVRTMKVGDTSEVIKSDNGFAILQITDRQEMAVPSLESVRGKIINTITLRKRSEQLEGIAAEENKEVKITIDEKRLAAWTYR